MTSRGSNCLPYFLNRGEVQEPRLRNVLQSSRTAPGFHSCSMAEPDHPQRCVPLRSPDIGVQASLCAVTPPLEVRYVPVSYRRGQTQGKLPGLRGESSKMIRRDNCIILARRAPGSMPRRAPLPCISTASITVLFLRARTKTTLITNESLCLE